MTTGKEWLVDASGCDAARLGDTAVLKGLFEDLIVALRLNVLGTPQWNTFPGPGGITGLALLSESHLTIHTFPEHHFAALNLYTCREREAPDFQALLAEHLRARSVTVRALSRESER